MLAIRDYGFFMAAVMVLACRGDAFIRVRLGRIRMAQLFYTPDELYAQIWLWGDACRAHYISFRVQTAIRFGPCDYTSFLIYSHGQCTKAIDPGQRSATII